MPSRTTYRVTAGKEELTFDNFSDAKNAFNKCKADGQTAVLEQLDTEIKTMYSCEATDEKPAAAKKAEKEIAPSS